MKSILILLLLGLVLPINVAAKSTNHSNKFYRAVSFFRWSYSTVCKLKCYWEWKLRERQEEECAASSKRACVETSYLRDL
jgi:hypothetical protein